MSLDIAKAAKTAMCLSWRVCYYIPQIKDSIARIHSLSLFYDIAISVFNLIDYFLHDLLVIYYVRLPLQ